MLTKDKVLELLHAHLESHNLRKHCYSVAAVMRALAMKLNGNPDTWEIAGLIHDVDYEEFPKTHPDEGIKILEQEAYPEDIINAVKAHAWGYRDGYPKPQSKFDWSLYCCDELTGFIVACALVRPDKKLSSVDIAAVQKKWKEKKFAAGVVRENIELCDKELGIPLAEFMQIALSAMQGISGVLGL